MKLPGEAAFEKQRNSNKPLNKKRHSKSRQVAVLEAVPIVTADLAQNL